MIRRVFLIVLDSVGVGELPDAGLYGDNGSDTMRAISQSIEFDIHNLRKIGLFNIDGLDYEEKETKVVGGYGKCAEKSAGKDTTTGHWEICGVISEKPFPTYPNGFPSEIISAFEKKIGTKTLCNMPYSGTEVISVYGSEHIKTGFPIVYTSGDSVFQIAAHEEIIPLQKLYDYCKVAREVLTGEHAVGRIIARPFIGSFPDFKRTNNRHDFSVNPPKTILNYLKDNSLSVIGIGKISDIFAGLGITETIHTHSNSEGMERMSEVFNKDFEGLCFLNLVDFDMLWGHRNDVDNYAKALSDFDKWLGRFLYNLKESDLVIITADHGCDPSTLSTDHSREYTPLLVYRKNMTPCNLGIRDSFSDIGKTITDIFNIKTDLAGDSFKEKIIK